MRCWRSTGSSRRGSSLASGHPAADLCEVAHVGRRRWSQVHLEPIDEFLGHGECVLAIAQFAFTPPFRLASEEAAKFAATRYHALVDVLVVRARDVWKPHVDIGLRGRAFPLEPLGETADAVDATGALLEFRRVPRKVMVDHAPAETV